MFIILIIVVLIGIVGAIAFLRLDKKPGIVENEADLFQISEIE